MANVFKVITKSGVGLVGSQTTLLTAPSAKTEIVLSLLLANKHTTSIKATVILSSDTTQTGGGASNADVYIIKDANIDAENSLEIMSGQKYIMNTTDILKVYADNANIDVVLSYMEQDV